jgi:hypothetical protein
MQVPSPSFYLEEYFVLTFGVARPRGSLAVVLCLNLLKLSVLHVHVVPLPFCSLVGSGTQFRFVPAPCVSLPPLVLWFSLSRGSSSPLSPLPCALASCDVNINSHVFVDVCKMVSNAHRYCTMSACRAYVHYLFSSYATHATHGTYSPMPPALPSALTACTSFAVLVCFRHCFVWPVSTQPALAKPVSWVDFGIRVAVV